MFEEQEIASNSRCLFCQLRYIVQRMMSALTHWVITCHTQSTVYYAESTTVQSHVSATVKVCFSILKEKVSQRGGSKSLAHHSNRTDHVLPRWLRCVACIRHNPACIQNTILLALPQDLMNSLCSGLLHCREGISHMF